jgi:hypothetical protein
MNVIFGDSVQFSSKIWRFSAIPSDFRQKFGDFRRFLPIFVKKLAIFLKKQCHDSLFLNQWLLNDTCWKNYNIDPC